jgi:hypothetical protein
MMRNEREAWDVESGPTLVFEHFLHEPTLLYGPLSLILEEQESSLVEFHRAWISVWQTPLLGIYAVRHRTQAVLRTQYGAVRNEGFICMHLPEMIEKDR